MKIVLKIEVGMKSKFLKIRVGSPFRIWYKPTTQPGLLK